MPRALVWDGEGAIGRWRAGRAELTAECQAFRGVLAAKVIICRPADPEAKGLIERSHDYLERSFLPGRTFASPADFNAQLAAWLAIVNTRTAAGTGLRTHRSHRRGPGRDAGAAAGGPSDGLVFVAAVAPRSLRAPGFQRLLGAPGRIGRRVLVRADLQRVQAFSDGQLVADHERIWAIHQTISDPDHVQAAKVLRRKHISTARPIPEPDVAIRCLTITTQRWVWTSTAGRPDGHQDHRRSA